MCFAASTLTRITSSSTSLADPESIDDVADVLEKINKIEKWRWMIMGGALVAGYVLAHIRIENLI